jgi:hypothetical protein
VIEEDVIMHDASNVTPLVETGASIENNPTYETNTGITGDTDLVIQLENSDIMDEIDTMYRLLDLVNDGRGEIRIWMT